METAHITYLEWGDRYVGNIIPLTSFPQGTICQHAAYPCSGIEKSN